MKRLRSIWKWWKGFWNYDVNMYGCIDSHKWESKIEAFGNLSSTHH